MQRWVLLLEAWLLVEARAEAPVEVVEALQESYHQTELLPVVPFRVALASFLPQQAPVRVLTQILLTLHMRTVHHQMRLRTKMMMDSN